MTISELCNAAATALQTWADVYGGKAIIAQGPAHMVELLAAKPGAPLVAVLYDGDTPSDVDETGHLRRRIKVILSFPRTLKLRAGDALAGDGEAPSQFDLVEEAREVIRQLDLDADSGERRASWTGTAVYQVSDLIFDAWEHSFSVLSFAPTAAPLPAA
jgi:hypothetical protein